MPAEPVGRRHRLTPKQTRTLLLCLDGIRYAAGICIGCHARALQQLHGFEQCEGLTVPTDAAVLVLADVWSCVDAVHRIRLLLNSTPALPKKDHAARVFLEQTRPVEELRHYVQHLNGEIRNLNEGSPPLWGTITWLKSDDPLTYFQLMTGTTIVKPSYLGPVFDSLEQKFVRRFELRAGTTSLDLDHLVQHVRTFDEAVHTWSACIHLTDGSNYQYSMPKSPLICAAFRPVPRPIAAAYERLAEHTERTAGRRAQSN